VADHVLATHPHSGIRNLADLIAQAKKNPGKLSYASFGNGTSAHLGGAMLANGGRVLGVTAVGASVREAQARAYAAVDRLGWAEGFCRRDIGWRAVARET